MTPNKIEFNINWNRLTIAAAVSAASCFLLGMIMRLRLLFFMADLIVFGTLIFSLAIFVIGLIKSKSKPKNSV